jgi:hypothetical protein
MIEMTVREQLIQELLTLPEAVVAELLNHARALRIKNGHPARDIAIVSERVLARDWLLSEEDEA